MLRVIELPPPDITAPQPPGAVVYYKIVGRFETWVGVLRLGGGDQSRKGVGKKWRI